MPLGKLARIAYGVMVFVLFNSSVSQWSKVVRGSYGGIVVVIVLGGAWPLCVRPGLYATMHMS